jgi:hypothetical protein
MPEILFDPQYKELKPLMEPDGSKPVYQLGNPIRNVQQSCEKARELIKAKGLAEHEVPVVHRPSGRIRVWDLRKGQVSASDCCQWLLGKDWRLATKPEYEQYKADCEKRRIEALDAKAEYEARKMTGEAVFQSLIRQASDTVAKKEK